MAALLIERSSEYINKLRNYVIVLDGKKIGKIADGEKKEFEVTPGEHTLKFSIDWTCSKEETFTIREAESKTFIVSGFKGARWMMPLGLVLIAMGMLMEIAFGFNPMIYFAGVIFAVLIFYVTIGRKRYLSIRQVDDNSNS